MKSIARSHLIAAVLSLVLFIATVIALVVFISRINSREQQVLDARDRLASYEQNKKELISENTELEGIRTRVEQLEKNIITEDTAPTFLSSVEAIAKNDGIDFTITTVAATTDPAKLHVDFSAEGSFANTQRFISDLLSQPYETQITKLSLYTSTNDKGASVWQLLAGMDVLSF